MKLLLLLLFVVSANAATLGSRKCSYGPSYWCGSILQAKECGAVQYCTDNDWANIRTKDGEFCSDCKLGIDALRKELSKASTEDEIVKAIESFCSNLGALAEDCKLVIDAYGTEVLKALINELEPEQICALMGFCKAETIVKDPKEDLSVQITSLLMAQASSKRMEVLQNQQMFVGGDNCADCTAFFGDVKDKLNDPAVEKEIMDDIKMLCQYLGAYKSECELIVTTLVPQAIGELVEKMVPKQVCSEIGFCQSSSMDEPTPEPPPNDPCSDCKAFMGDVKTMLSNTTVQKMILQDLESLCNDLGSLAPQCQQYVEQYGSLVFTLLLQQFDPASVCGVIKFCPAVDASVTAVSSDGCSDCKIAVQAFTSLLSNPELQTTILLEVSKVCSVLGPNAGECKQMISEYGPLLFSLVLEVMDPSSFCSEIGFCAVESEPEALPEPGDICTDCENFVNDFDSLLNNYTVQQKFLKDLTVVCKYFPNYADECRMYVLQYGDLVFEVIAGFLNPRAICTDLGLCQGETRQPLRMPQIPLKLIQNMAPTNACVDCKTIFQDIQKLLSDPDVQKMFIQDLELLCNDLGALGPTCKQYVDEYGDMVFNFLIQYIDPDAICSAIGLCQSGLRQSPPKINADQCTDCKNFFQDVSTILNTPSVQQEILQELETLCNDLGPSIGPQCQQYVSEYGPLAINFLLQYLDPTTVCGEIGFCSSDTRPLAFMALKTILSSSMDEPIPEPPPSNDPCTDCKNFFQDVATMLNTPSVQQEIIQDLESLCNELGPSTGPQCQQYVSEYGPLVINYLLQYLDPTAICGDIKFCPSVSPVELAQLNADQCTDCKDFFQDVSNMLKNTSVQQMIIQEIENLCNDLGPSISPQCQQYVSEYGPLVFNYLLQYLDPTAVCGDIGFCTTFTILPMNLIKVNADQCTDCKNFFQDVSDMLKNASVQQMIIQEIENLCNELGPSIGPQCQQYVSEYGPLVFNILLQYLDPTAVCGDIGFCTAVTRPPMNLIEVNADQCTDCKNFFQDVSNMLKNVSVQQMIIQEIENLCNDLGPSIAPQCQQYVSEYGPLVFNYLLQYLDPTAVCGDIGFCSAVTGPPMDLIKGNADQCTDCTNFFQDVVTILKDPNNQQMIIQDIENLCNDLGPSIGPQCQQYVSEYGPLVFNFLLPYLDPQQVCSTIGFCNAVSPAEIFKVNADQCTDCKNFFKDVMTILDDPATQQMIIQELENLCNDLGPSIGPQCQQYVSEYGPLVFNYLLQYLDPTAICGDIGFCTATLTQLPKIFDVNADQCTDCKNFFKDVTDVLNQPATQQMIIQELENLCNDLGPSIVPQCQQYVSEYGPLVFNYLLQHLDPTAICGDIGFCSAQLLKVPDVNADQCTDCTNFFKDVLSMLNKPATQQMIIQEIENLCNDLGPSIGPQCQRYVSEYGPLVINYLLQYLDPPTVCKEIGFCSMMHTMAAMDLTAARPVSTLRAETPEVLGEESAVACEICELVVKHVGLYLQENATEEEIVAALEEFCSILPSSIADECNGLLEEYGLVIVKLLISEVDPDKVCTFLKLCSSNEDLEASTRCTLCEYAMTELDKLITNNSSIAEIEAALNKVCTFLPSTLTAECESFVATYTETIVNLILQNVSPQLICKAIGLCKTEVATAEVEAGPECAICEYVMEKLDTLISKDSTEEEIEAALDKVCSLLPTITEECQTLVNTYTPAIINLLLQEVPPQLVCKALGLCSSELATTDVEFGPVCALCKLVMKKLENMLASNASISNIEAALEEVCSLLPSRYSTKCQNFVDEYTPRIINLLSQCVPPGIICRVLHLCIFEDSLERETKPGPECVLCEYVLTELDKLLVKDATISDIKAALDKVCGLLPSTLTAQCQSFVNVYTETIVNLLIQNVSPQLICRAITLCKAEEPRVQEPEVGADDLCAICEFAMSEFDKLLDEPGTEAEIEALLEKVCAALPSTISETCKSFVAEYTKEIIFLITQSVTPKQVCSALTLCTSEQVVEAVPDVPAAVTDLADVDTSTECIVCEFAMKEIEEQLGKNATEAEIQEALGEVCDLLPESIREDCNILITYYTAEVIYQFIRKYPASKICQLLKVCVAVNGEMKSVAHVPVEAGPECAICEFVAKELEGMLQKDSTEVMIRQALDKICDLLPATITDNCVEFVDYYTEEIIFILVSQFPPDKLCSTIRLCIAVEEETGPEIVGADENTPQCAVCELVAAYLEKELQNNATEAEIEAALEGVCSMLPFTVNRECTEFVEYYTQEIIFILTSQFPPDKLCTLLKLCTASDQPETNDVSVTCEVCIIAVRSAELYITKNSTEAEIDKILNELCKTFPGGLQEQCLSLVEAFGNVFPELIVALGDPDKVCQVIELCPRQSDVKRLAFEKCKSGPEFWCASQTNADLCDAVEHCKRHVWN